VATIPHDWHTIVRSRSSRVIDFNVIWKPIFDFLLVINSNLGPLLHRLATIHPLQKTTDDDGRQPWKTPTELLSFGALWLKSAFPAWRNHTGWSVTTAWQFDIAAMELWAQRHLGRHSGRHSGKRLSAAECHHQCRCRWDSSSTAAEKGTSTAHSVAPTNFFPVALETLGPMSVSTQKFLAHIGRRLTEVTTDPRETTFLCQRLSVTVQRFNAACLADTFAISKLAS